MSFKDRMKDAAAQAAVQARKAAEQARELAAEVKEQAEEKWAEEQQRRAADPTQSEMAPPAAANTAANEPHTPAAPQPPDWTPSPSVGQAPSLKGKWTDAAARAAVQARKSVEDARDHGLAAQGQARQKSPLSLKAGRPARPQRPELPSNRVLIGLGGAIVVLAAVITTGAILENNDENSAPSSTSAAPPASAPTAKEAETETMASTAPADPAPTEAVVADITVNHLLDRLNSVDMGGIKTGDRFMFTGELMRSEYWFTSVTGDYVVDVKAKGGANDLQIFVNEADAEEWTDGTKVEVVVVVEERTLDGETSSGWLVAQSVKVLSGGTNAEEKAAGSEEKMLKDADSVRKTFNTLATFDAFLRVGPGSAEGVVYVYLDPSFLVQDVDLSQQFINQFNEVLVETLGDNAAFDNMVKYYIGDQLVGENKEFLDPYTVDFKGGLEK